MQRFDNSKGKRRELNIENMKIKEVKEYYLQNLELSTEEKKNRESQLKERIKRSKEEGFYEWILVIKLKDGKVIGKIEVLQMGPDRAFLTINLPNKNWKLKYGVEAIKQFVKICKENNYFSIIELEKNNSIVQRYIEAYGETYGVKDYLIDVMKVA